YPLMRSSHAPPSVAAAPHGPVGHALACSNTRHRTPQTDSIEQVVLRRVSSRRFTGESITLDALSTILERSTRGIPADFPPMNEIYLIVNNVDGLQQGSYYYNSGEQRLELLHAGDVRARAAFLALEQQLAGDAAVAVFFLADLHRWLS